jgi:hypothetical protein
VEAGRGKEEGIPASLNTVGPPDLSLILLNMERVPEGIGKYTQY